MATMRRTVSVEIPNHAPRRAASVRQTERSATRARHLARAPSWLLMHRQQDTRRAFGYDAPDRDDTEPEAERK